DSTRVSDFCSASRCNHVFRSFPTRRSSDLQRQRGGTSDSANLAQDSVGDAAGTADHCRAFAALCPELCQSACGREIYRFCRRSRSKAHTSELQSRSHLVCPLLLQLNNLTVY